MLLAWTAVYVIALAAAIAVTIILLRIVMVSLASGRTRLILDAHFALLCLMLLWLLF